MKPWVKDQQKSMLTDLDHKNNSFDSKKSSIMNYTSQVIETRKSLINKSENT